MNLPVVLSPKASASLHEFAQWWAANRSLEQAQRWYDGFIAALEALGGNPHRGGLARENRRFSYEIRELLYGVGSHPTHRAVYTVRPDMIFVLAIRHAAQDDLTVDDV
jgi:plasmid stabilization system protein ParE